MTHPPYFTLFPQLNIRLKGHHFDRIEMIEAESQAVLNTLSRITRLPGCISEIAEALQMVHMRGRRLFSG
jgi:hypothetical protein